MGSMCYMCSVHTHWAYRRWYTVGVYGYCRLFPEATLKPAPPSIQLLICSPWLLWKAHFEVGPHAERHKAQSSPPSTLELQRRAFLVHILKRRCWKQPHGGRKVNMSHTKEFISVSYNRYNRRLMKGEAVVCPCVRSIPMTTGLETCTSLHGEPI